MKGALSILEKAIFFFSVRSRIATALRYWLFVQC